MKMSEESSKSNADRFLILISLLPQILVDERLGIQAAPWPSSMKRWKLPID
jgi:hypothetical protein